MNLVANQKKRKLNSMPMRNRIEKLRRNKKFLNNKNQTKLKIRTKMRLESIKNYLTMPNN